MGGLSGIKILEDFMKTGFSLMKPIVMSVSHRRSEKSSRSFPLHSYLLWIIA
jgi:hypothetical protein